MDMETYQQVILYIWPLLGQLQFINTMVVLVRLHWFRKKFKDIGMSDQPPRLTWPRFISAWLRFK